VVNARANAFVKCGRSAEQVAVAAENTGEESFSKVPTPFRSYYYT